MKYLFHSIQYQLDPEHDIQEFFLDYLWMDSINYNEVDKKQA